MWFLSFPFSFSVSVLPVVHNGNSWSCWVGSWLKQFSLQKLSCEHNWGLPSNNTVWHFSGETSSQLLPCTFCCTALFQGSKLMNGSYLMIL
jgi:hypothetical protein